MDQLRHLFDSTRFMPHGHCYLWTPDILWLHVSSDLVIFIAYYSIPITLIYFISKKRTFPFNWVFWMFGAFILLCGTTHIMNIWTTWYPTYFLEGVVKAVTALVSIVTAVSLWFLLPKALSLPTMDDVKAMNRTLVRRNEEIEIEREKSEKAAQLEKEVNLELEQFAYIVSHDLKAPLRGIRSLADWLYQDNYAELNADGKENLTLLQGRVTRMDTLINGILRYSRVSRDKLPQERFDLEPLVAQVIDALAPPETIKIVIETPLPRIMGVEIQIEQVFQNLISNAITYMNKPEGVVKIRCRESEDGKFWIFSISDNGLGIAREHFERVFKLFETLSPSDASDEGASTGIGLSIVKRIVERHGGRVWLESELGEGSTFFFSLPRDPY